MPICACFLVLNDIYWGANNPITASVYVVGICPIYPATFPANILRQNSKGSIIPTSRKAALCGGRIGTLHSWIILQFSLIVSMHIVQALSIMTTEHRTKTGSFFRTHKNKFGHFPPAPVWCGSGRHRSLRYRSLSAQCTVLCTQWQCHIAQPAHCNQSQTGCVSGTGLGPVRFIFPVHVSLIAHFSSDLFRQLWGALPPFTLRTLLLLLWILQHPPRHDVADVQSTRTGMN